MSHGGANSVSEALGCGVPILGLPIAWDQPANVSIVVDDLRCGLGLPLATVTSESLLTAMRSVLGEPGYAARARAVARRMRALDRGAAGAADLVERAAATFDGAMREAAAAAGGGGGGAAEEEEPELDESVEGWGDGLD